MNLTFLLAFYRINVIVINIGGEKSLGGCAHEDGIADRVADGVAGGVAYDRTRWLSKGIAGPKQP
jgi:hypothetical protein